MGGKIKVFLNIFVIILPKLDNIACKDASTHSEINMTTYLYLGFSYANFLAVQIECAVNMY